MTDRSSSLTNNVRSFGTQNIPYDKLTLRLTPKIIESREIIRIPAKNTLQISSQMYSQVKKNPWMDLGSPSNRESNSPVNLIPNSPPIEGAGEETIISSKITKSYLSASTTHNWENECKILKESIESQKSIIQTLEVAKSKLQQQLSKSLTEIHSAEERDFRNRLEETQLRMGEQNQYLRECMLKLQQQLDYVNSNFTLNINRQLELSQYENRKNLEELRLKDFQISKREKDYQSLLRGVEEQKITGQKMHQNLLSLEDKVILLEKQNKNVQRQKEELRRINEDLLKAIQQQKLRNRELIHDNSNIKKDIENRKQIAEQLKISMARLKHDNLGLNKLSQVVTPKSKNSFIPKITLERSSQSRMSLKSLVKSPSSISVFDQEGFEFSLSLYINRTEQFNLLRNQNEELSRDQVSALIYLAEYFNNSVEKLLSEQVKNQKLMEKYKKIVESIQNPRQQSKQSVQQLIDKCTLLESSVEEKKDTIDRLNEKINELTREKEETKDKQFKSPEQKYDKMRWFNNQKDKNAEEGKRLSEGGGIFERFKQFKPVAFVEQRQSIGQKEQRVETIQGQKDFKQTQKQLKAYEKQIVPSLKKQIKEYKQIINNFSNSSNQDSVLNQSSLTYTSNEVQTSRISRLMSHSFDKRKERTVGLSQPFQQSCLEKPETSECHLTHNNLEKKRLDLLNRSKLTKQTILTILEKLIEVARTMSKNSNFMTIAPDSIYLINYHEDNITQAKIKVLETSRIRQEAIKKYWAPENIKGEVFGELSLVWNIGLIFEQFLFGRGCFEQPTKQKLFDEKLPVFRRILEAMLEPLPSQRGKLEQIQQLILKNKNIFK